MRPIRLTALVLLSLAISTAMATPLKQRSKNLAPRIHAARQIEATTPYALRAKSGYPAAGFRPHIPFELPNERKPKGLPDVEKTTTTEAVTTKSALSPTDAGGGNVDVEVVVESSEEEGNVENNENSIEVERTATTTKALLESASSEIEITEVEVEAHTPAIEYGPPTNGSSKDFVEDEKIEEPAKNFQPPNKDAADFVVHHELNANSNAVAVGPAPHAADFPTQEAGLAKDVSVRLDVSSELEADAAEEHMPAATYGPPTDRDNAHQPAETYSTPNDEVVPPEVEEEDFGVEFSEMEAATTNEEADLTAEQIDLLGGFSELQSGRLIFVPADGSNLRQIYFAAPPQQRRAKKSERLIRV